MTSAFLYEEYYFMLLYKSMLSFVIWKQYLNAHKCKMCQPLLISSNLHKSLSNKQ